MSRGNSISSNNSNSTYSQETVSQSSESVETVAVEGFYENHRFLNVFMLMCGQQVTVSRLQSAVLDFQ